MKALRMMLGCLAGVCGCAVAVLVSPAAQAADIEPPPQAVYNNTANSLDAYHGMGGSLEFGDEIVMDGFGTQLLLGIKLFEFSYTTTPGFVESTAKTGWLRFYALNGDSILPPGGSVPSNRPGSLLIDPVKFVLYDGGGYVIWPTSFVAPRRMAWTVSFEGLAPGEDVGLDLFDPPTVGASGHDFWVREPSGWQLREISHGAIHANFYARVLAIPEPGVLSLGGLAALGWMVSRWVRRQA
jgi:hypothetical protein